MQHLVIEESELPINLEVIVSNVADEGNRNKNRFKLYVNNRLIKPQNEIDNTTRTYFYSVKLQPGYYEVKGMYYWHDGWEDSKTEVRTEELIRVDASGRTTLEIEISKDWRGIVRSKKIFFDVSYQLFEKKTIVSADSVPTTPMVSETEVVVEQKQEDTRVKFQINTDPTHCTIYVDDQLIGESPISWWVDINTPHVVQSKHDNYRTAIQMIPPEEMKNQEKVIIIQRLEPLPGLSMKSVDEKKQEEDSKANDVKSPESTQPEEQNESQEETKTADENQEEDNL